MGRFDDRATQPQRGFGDVLRWRAARLRRGGDRDDGQAARFSPPLAVPDLALLASAAPSLTWIGHATFLVRLGGRLVATDPIWSERISGVLRRRAAPGVAFDDLPPVDVVTVSHNHFDHLDLPTIRRLGAAPLYVTPLGNGGYLERAGAERVVELDWWQTHTIDGGEHGPLDITLVPARHWSMRMPWTRNDALWGGFVLRARDSAAYHSGDTALFDGFAEIGRRLGPIDWALLPIGAYEPRWFMQSQHMNPEDAAEAFAALGARIFCAMHWGTFQLTDEPLGEPPGRIRAAFAARDLDPARLWLLAIGETRALR